jgi:hypothetical protein
MSQSAGYESSSTWAQICEILGNCPVVSGIIQQHIQHIAALQGVEGLIFAKFTFISGAKVRALH